MTKPRLYTLLFLWALGPLLAFAQSSPTLELIDVIPHEKEAIPYLELQFKALDAEGFPLFAEGQNKGLSVAYWPELDQITRDTAPYIQQLDASYDSTGTSTRQQAALTVLFLLDLSGSMIGDNLEEAKAAVKQVLDIDVLRQADVQYAFFHDSVFVSQPLRKTNYATRIGEAKAYLADDTDLYRAIYEKSEELRQIEGQKVLIVLTDGRNDNGDNERYAGPNAPERIERDSLLRYASRLDSTLQIFSVGFGPRADQVFLDALPDATPNPDDDYYFGEAPTAITPMFVKIAKKVSGPNFSLNIQPNRIFGTEQYRFQLSYQSTEQPQPLDAYKDVVLGSPAAPLDMRINAGNTDYTSALITGVALLLLLYIILSFSVPIINNFNFKRRHLRKYHQVRQQNRRLKDPLTLEPLQDDDEVVVSSDGKKILKLTTWKYFMNAGKQDQVGEYAELFQLQTSSRNFFSQRGNFRQLNWLWFGAAGGFLTWGILILLQNADLSWYADWLAGLLNREGPNGTQIATAVFGETLVGVSMGIGMVGALALVEELGQSRVFNPGRVLLRILIGTVMGFLIFSIEGTLITKYIPVRYLGQLIGWISFGTLLGLTVALFSSIELTSGLKGGLLASFIAFHVYYLLNLPFLAGVITSQIAKVLSFTYYGAVLGYTLFTVVKHLSAYELRCLAPLNYSGWQSPLSKWLKDSNIDYIAMGSSPKNRIYLKWHDLDPAIRPEHARLFTEQGTVYIAPREGEVYVNRQLVKKRQALANNDEIVLGRNNITRLQFLSSVEGEATLPTLPPTNGHSKGKVRDATEVAQIRSQIKISKRTY